MKLTLTKFIMLTFASAASLAVQANAQGGPDTSALAYVSGTFSVTAPAILGSNPATALRSRPVTIAGVIEQEGSAVTNITKGGANISITTPFVKYAFGNKEIIQLAFNDAGITNSPAGSQLRATNSFTNSLQTYGYTVLRPGTSGWVPVPSSLFEVSNGDQLTSSVIAFKGTNLTEYNGVGYLGYDFIFLEAFPAYGVGKFRFDNLASHTFRNGTNKTTARYLSDSVSGSFSGTGLLSDE